MRRPENIYVSLQLCKDDKSREMLLNIQFDRDAPNFFINKNSISWCPTIEEQDFISEAFGILSKRKLQRQDRMDESNHQESPTEDLMREADETEILDRVLQKKRPSFNQG
jgi:hypothetical protein